MTGHRLGAAAAMTARPVRPDPVNRMWSNFSFENSMPTPPVSSKNASLSRGKYLGRLFNQQLGEMAGVFHILTMERLPAAKAAMVR